MVTVILCVFLLSYVYGEGKVSETPLLLTHSLPVEEPALTDYCRATTSKAASWCLHISSLLWASTCPGTARIWSSWASIDSTLWPSTTRRASKPLAGRGVEGRIELCFLLSFSNFFGFESVGRMYQQHSARCKNVHSGGSCRGQDMHMNERGRSGAWHGMAGHGGVHIYISRNQEPPVLPLGQGMIRSLPLIPSPILAFHSSPARTLLE